MYKTRFHKRRTQYSDLPKNAITSLKISLEDYKFRVDQEEMARKLKGFTENYSYREQNLKVMTKRI